MSFITQTETSGNSCGAYCLCYLEWLKKGRRPENPLTEEEAKKDLDQVRDVYAAIQFGDSCPKLEPVAHITPDYCDPVRMILLLGLSHYSVSFFMDTGSSLYPVLKAMNAQEARDHAFISALMEAGDLYTTNPPLPGPNQFTIAIYNVINSMGLCGQHYILFQEKDGYLYCYNPWDGVATPCTGYAEFIYTGKSGETVTLRPADAAILVA